MLRRLQVIAMVSIHAPHAGGDVVVVDISRMSTAFQSTPPTRGATF